MTSHINIYAPFSSESITKFSCPNFPWSVRYGRALHNRMKVAAEKRDSLDHLQRANHQQSQSKRAPQVAPTGWWDRFPTARTVQQMMERMMEDPFSYGSSWPTVSATERDGYSRGRTPWAIKEGEKGYKMRFDMPGMTKDDVKVSVEERMLIIKGEKVPQTTQENGHEHIVDEEWPTKSNGRYGFRIALPENIEFEKIQAEVKDGVLYVVIPKASVITKVVDIDVQ